MYDENGKQLQCPSAGSRFSKAKLGGPMGLLPAHCNKARIAVKQALTFLLVESLAFNLCKTTVKLSKGKCNKMRYVCTSVQWNTF